MCWSKKRDFVGSLLVMLCCLFASSYSIANINKNLHIDRVVVLKSKRLLLLFSGQQVVKKYKVSLGKQPKGHKTKQGDKKTPEGLYWIDWRQASKNYNLSMHISYPNHKDATQARQQGVDPGGMIMIHGTPISKEFPEWYFKGLNWTDGCIALLNDDMQEVWSMVKNGTLIDIRP